MYGTVSTSVSTFLKLTGFVDEFDGFKIVETQITQTKPLNDKKIL